jgi:hypothetical protein
MKQMNLNLFFQKKKIALKEHKEEIKEGKFFK